MGGKKRYSMRGRMMKANISIMLAALVLCGGIFAVSVFLIVGDYIHTDLRYFLTTTTGNLEKKLEYCEQVIYALRKSDTLMEYLAAPQETDREQAEAAFSRAADISASDNLADGSIPLVEEIYLFPDGDRPLSTSYYAMITAEREAVMKQFSAMYERYQKEHGAGSGEYAYYPAEDSVFLVYPLLDDTMDPSGEVIYKLKSEAVRNMMQSMGNYRDSFWALYDSRNRFVLGEGAVFAGEDARALFREYRYRPYLLELGGREYRVFRKKMSMDLQVVLGIPENQTMFLMVDSVRIYVMLIAVITLLGCLVSFVVIYRLTRPIEEITDKLQEVKEGNFETKLPAYGGREFNEISETFNGMTAYISNLVNQVYEKQLSIKDMELKFLQSQMNPHFMFNVLNSLALQARLDQNEELYRMISSFSRLVQAKIYRDGREKVKIGQELEYVEYYLSLQNYRFGDHLQYEIRVEDEALKEFYIPKLCIQLIVENAVVHGIEPKLEGGNVRVLVSGRDGCIRIDTVDDGIGFAQDGAVSLPLKQKESDSAHNHVGLNNAHHIIRMMYGGTYGITINSQKGQGTTVSICIPFDENSGWGNEDDESHAGG